MARFNNRWFDVVVSGAVGVVATWRVVSVLSAGRFQYRHRGQNHLFSPESEPFWYWLWVALLAGIAAYCLLRVLRAGWEIVQVYRMDRRIEERERLGDSYDEVQPGVNKVMTVERSVTIKTVGEDGQQHEYHSKDDVPPEIRSKIKALEAEPIKGDESAAVETSRTGNTVTTKITRRRDVSVFKITDASGVEHTYHSLEEMPPELRAAVLEAEEKLRDRTHP